MDEVATAEISSERDSEEFSRLMQLHDGTLLGVLSRTLLECPWEAAAVLSMLLFSRRLWFKTAIDSSNASSMAQFALIAESFSQVHLRPWLAANWSSACWILYNLQILKIGEM